MQMTAAWAETTGRGCSGLRPQVEPGPSTSARGRGLVVLGEGHGFVFVTGMSGEWCSLRVSVALPLAAQGRHLGCWLRAQIAAPWSGPSWGEACASLG